MSRLQTTIAGAACLALMAAAAHAAVFQDPGFESYSVEPGGLVMPTEGVWTFTNNAGVVRPYAPNSSTEPLVTWSATREAFQGNQYVSTYAGWDTVRQSVWFDRPGRYELSVTAFAPSGTLTTIGLAPNSPVVDGEFAFWFGGATIGPTWAVPAGSDWTTYSTTLDVGTAGYYSLGVHNTLTDTYFINYDNFSIAAVPEPVAGTTLLPVAMCALLRRGRSHDAKRV